MRLFLLCGLLFSAVCASVSGQVSEEYQQEFLKAHNFYRAKHGVGPLKISETLNVLAQEWADHIAKTGVFEHRANNILYGENIYGGFNISNVVKQWYDEVEYYHYYGKEPQPARPGKPYGHFTQIVWKATTEVGIGIAYVIDKNGRKKAYVVADYNPSGNYKGQYAKNVLKPLSSHAFRTKNYHLVLEDKYGNSIDKNFRQNFLDAHNRHRAAHGVGPLKLDHKISGIAQQWADHLASKGGNIEHRPNNKFGENIHSSSSTGEIHMNGTEAVEGWYKEEEKYQDFYGKEPTPPTCSEDEYRHFTALIWKETTAVGVGVAFARQGIWNKVYVVANYLEAGNMRGAYAENVPPPI